MQTENRQPNRLIHEASPYLQQHAHNPVDWYPWGPEALQRAKNEDKPIFLSVGYSACHWCHVMEHESFESQEIAAIMNEHFINIKVDREERPDLDQIYQSICQVVTRQGGWPLSVFLTPDQKPFYVGTYYPPSERYGRPGFKQLLGSLSKAYREKREEVDRVAESWTGAITHGDSIETRAEFVPPRQLISTAARALLARVDQKNGGFGGAPKFPGSSNLEVMLRHYHLTKDQAHLDAVLLSLRKMAQGGIYDHLGGGFHRYSVDAEWAVPHFEKMLYDNAMLPPVYLSAWQITGDPLFRNVVVETLDYVIREMTHPGGGFYSTTDADSEGEEGKFFVFDRADTFEAVGPDLGDLMCRHFGITMDGNFEHTGKTVLYISESAQAIAERGRLTLEEIETQLTEGRRLMLAYRERRVPPFRDEKILTAWNGLMISAFARAGRILRIPRFTEAAKRSADFVRKQMTGPDGSLLRRWKDDQAGIIGFNEDYAFFTAGLLDLYEVTFEDQYLELAKSLAQATVHHFYDGAGGFYLTRSDGEPLVHRPKDTLDSSTPSASSVAVLNLLRLVPFTGDDSYREIAEAAFRAYHDHMQRYAGGMGTLLQALDLYHASPTEVSLVGDLPEEWLQKLGAYFDPNLMITQVRDAQGEVPIWAGKSAKNGQPTVYICRNFTCSPPLVDWEQIEQALQ